jgi:hypothetical protein
LDDVSATGQDAGPQRRAVLVGYFSEGYCGRPFQAGDVFVEIGIVRRMLAAGQR